MNEPTADKYAVIFDMDGVLVDSYEPHYISWVDTCRTRGFPITREVFAGLFGRSFRAFAEALSTRPLTEIEIQEWYDEKEGRYREIIESDFPEIDGASDLIKTLHDAGFLVGVASSGPRGNVECLLKHLPFAEHIGATVSADEVTRTKPHPEPFLTCAAKLGVIPGNCAIVEDSVYGLQAGHAAGMATIALAGTSPETELAKQADLVVHSLRELDADVIRKLASAPRPTLTV
ncbi:MAG: HAD family phosphatase [Bacteroidota bacterium]